MPEQTNNQNRTPEVEKVLDTTEELLQGEGNIEDTLDTFHGEGNSEVTEQNIIKPDNETNIAMLTEMGSDQFQDIGLDIDNTLLPNINEEVEGINEIRKELAKDSIENSDFLKLFKNKDEKKAKVQDELSGITQGQSENLYTLRPDDLFETIGGQQISRYPEYIEGIDNEDRMAAMQSKGEKFRRGSLKFLGGVAATVLGNTIGTITGGLNALAEGDLNAVTDDSFNMALFEWQQRLEHKLPNYVSAKEREMNFFQKLGTANMWLDELPQGLSYIVGFMAGEAIWGAATLGMGSAIPALRLSKQLKNLRAIKNVKAEKEINKIMLRNALTQSKMAKYNRLGRAGDALNTTRYIWTSSGYDAGTEVRQLEMTARDEFYQYYRDELGRNPEAEEIQNFREDLEDAKRKAFWTNMVTVGMTNVALYGRVFNIKNPLSSVGKSIDDRVFGKGFTTNEAGRQVRREANKLQKITDWTYTNMLRPAAYQGGWEAAGQHNIRETASEWLQAGYNEEYTRDQANMIEAILENVSESYTTKEGWNSIGQGMLIGMIGRLSHIPQGGPARTRAREAKYNEILKGDNYSAESLLDRMKTLNRVRAANERYDEAQESGNGPGMKLAEDSSMLSVIAMHEKYGMSEVYMKDLEAMLNASKDSEVAEMLGVEETQVAEKKQEFLGRMKELTKRYKRAKEFSTNIIGKRAIPKELQESKEALIETMAYTITVGQESGDALNLSVNNVKDLFKNLPSEFRTAFEEATDAHMIFQRAGEESRAKYNKLIKEREKAQQNKEEAQKEIDRLARERTPDRVEEEGKQPQKSENTEKLLEAQRKLQEAEETIERVDIEASALESEILTTSTPYEDASQTTTTESHAKMFQTTNVDGKGAVTSLKPLFDYMDSIKDTNPMMYEKMKVRLNDLRLSINAHKYYNDLVKGITDENFDIPQFATKLGYRIFGGKSVNEHTRGWAEMILSERLDHNKSVDDLLQSARPEAPDLTFTQSDVNLMTLEELSELREELAEEIENNPNDLTEERIEELTKELSDLDTYIEGVEEVRNRPTGQPIIITADTVRAVKEIRAIAEKEKEAINKLDPNKKHNQEIDSEIKKVEQELQTKNEQLNERLDKLKEERQEENQTLREEIEKLNSEKQELEGKLKELGKKQKDIDFEKGVESPQVDSVAGYNINYETNTATKEGEVIKAESLSELKVKLIEALEASKAERINKIASDYDLGETELVDALEKGEYTDPYTGKKYKRNEIDKDGDAGVIRSTQTFTLVPGKVTDSKGNTTDAEYTYRYKVISAKEAQASHDYEGTNKNHFISRGQPKDRTIENSAPTVERIANNRTVRSESLMEETENAYTSAPIVNTRNEVGQGNARMWGLKEGYKRNGRNYKYREALLKDKNLESKGLLGQKAQIEKIEDPILVRELVVENPSEVTTEGLRKDDATIIEFGQFQSSDIEGANRRVFDPKRTAVRFVTAKDSRASTSRKRTLLNILKEITEGYKGQENPTLNSIILSAQSTISKLLMSDNTGIMSADEKITSFKNGILTKEGRAAFAETLKELLFLNTTKEVRNAFDTGITEAQRHTIESLIPEIVYSDNSKSLVPQLQEAIVMLKEARGFKSFKDYETQYTVERNELPKETYSEVAIEIARDIYNSNTNNRGELRTKFRKYRRAVEGDKAVDINQQTSLMMDAREAKTKAEAIKEVFGVYFTQESIEKAQKLQRTFDEQAIEQATEQDNREVSALVEKINELKKEERPELQTDESLIAEHQDRLRDIERQVEEKRQQIRENNKEPLTEEEITSTEQVVSEELKELVDELNELQKRLTHLQEVDKGVIVVEGTDYTVNNGKIFYQDTEVVRQENETPKEAIIRDINERQLQEIKKIHQDNQGTPKQTFGTVYAGRPTPEGELAFTDTVDPETSIFRVRYLNAERTQAEVSVMVADLGKRIEKSAVNSPDEYLHRIFNHKNNNSQWKDGIVTLEPTIAALVDGKWVVTEENKGSISYGTKVDAQQSLVVLNRNEVNPKEFTDKLKASEAKFSKAREQVQNKDFNQDAKGQKEQEISKLQSEIEAKKKEIEESKKDQPDTTEEGVQELSENKYQRENVEIEKERREAEEEYLNKKGKLESQRITELTEQQVKEKAQEIDRIERKEAEDIEKIKRGEEVDQESVNIIMKIENHIVDNPELIYFIGEKDEQGNFGTIERAVPENLNNKVERLSELYDKTQKNEEMTEAETQEFESLVEEFKDYTLLEGSLIGETTLAELIERYNQLRQTPVDSKAEFTKTDAINVSESTNKEVIGRKDTHTTGQFPEGVWLKRVALDRYELSHMSIENLEANMIEKPVEIQIKEAGDTDFKMLTGLTQAQQKTKGNVFKFIMPDGTENTVLVGSHSRLIFNSQNWNNIIEGNTNISFIESEIDPNRKSHKRAYTVNPETNEVSSLETDFQITNERADHKELATNEEAFAAKEVSFAVDMADTYNRELMEEYNNSEKTDADKNKVRENINIYMMAGDKILWQTRSGRAEETTTSGENFNKLRFAAFKEAESALSENAFIELKAKAPIKSTFSGVPFLNLRMEDGVVEVDNMPLDQAAMERVVDFGYIQDGEITLKNKSELTNKPRAYLPTNPQRTPIVVFKYGGQNIPIPASIPMQANPLPEMVQTIVEGEGRAGQKINEINSVLLENGIRPSDYNLTEETISLAHFGKLRERLEAETPSPDPAKWMNENTKSSLPDNTFVPMEVGKLGRPKPIIDFENIEGINEVEVAEKVEAPEVQPEVSRKINEKKNEDC